MGGNVRLSKEDVAVAQLRIVWRSRMIALIRLARWGFSE